jgi:hypothetical protein
MLLRVKVLMISKTHCICERVVNTYTLPEFRSARVCFDPKWTGTVFRTA